ncbi:MAG TPA: hypothetical protein VII63_10350 [Caulobacteraceae bacterium]
MTLKPLPGLIAALLLGGCNVVTSTDPWFTDADAAGAASLRTGVWTLSGLDKPCRFDDRRPIETWPECAGPILVREHDILSFDEPAAETPRRGSPRPWDSMAFVLAAGSPRILQTAPSAKDLRSRPEGSRTYLYQGLEPLRFDPQGRIVAFTLSFVVCDGKTISRSRRGDADATAAQADEPIRPLAGLTMDAAGEGCIAQSKVALVNAAKVSAPNATYARSRWVRDGER